MTLKAGRLDLQPVDSMGVYRILVTIGAVPATVANIMAWLHDPVFVAEEESVTVSLPTAILVEIESYLEDDDNIDLEAIFGEDLDLEEKEGPDEETLHSIRIALQQAIISGEHEDILDLLHQADLRNAASEFVLELIQSTLDAGLPQYSESLVMAANLDYRLIPREIAIQIRAFRRQQAQIPFVESTALLSLPSNPSIFTIDMAFHAILNDRSIKMVWAHFDGQPVLVDAYLNLTNNLQGLWNIRADLIQASGVEAFVAQYNDLISAFNDLLDIMRPDENPSTTITIHSEDSKTDEEDDTSEPAHPVEMIAGAITETLSPAEEANLQQWIAAVEENGMHGAMDALSHPRHGPPMNISGQGINYNVGGKIIAANLYHLKVSGGVRVFFSEDPFGTTHVILVDNHTTGQAERAFRTFLRNWNEQSKRK